MENPPKKRNRNYSYLDSKPIQMYSKFKNFGENSQNFTERH